MIDQKNNYNEPIKERMDPDMIPLIIAVDYMTEFYGRSSYNFMSREFKQLKPSTQLQQIIEELERFKSMELQYENACQQNQK